MAIQYTVYPPYKRTVVLRSTWGTEEWEETSVRPALKVLHPPAITSAIIHNRNIFENPFSFLLSRRWKRRTKATVDQSFSITEPLEDTMAEFDNAGFSALDSFFGDSATEAAETSKQTVPKPQQAKIKRRGVGSAMPKRSEKQNLAEMVLKVGKKRSYRDGDDEEDELSTQEQQHDDDDDEDSGGRTGIAPKKAVANTRNELQRNEKSGKHKMGKKERQQLKEANKKLESALDKGEEIPVEEIPQLSKEDERSPRKKHKRRKIRSRQKNIRKDNRSNEEKPKYLVPGKSIYRGRPMTKETREKLNLPAPKTRPLFVIDRSSTTMDSNDVGLKLGIEDLLEGDADVSKKSVEKLNKKKKKKASKSRYKNL